MRYVEGLHDASTPPADIVSILLGAEWPRTTSRTILPSRNPTVTARIKSKFSKDSTPSGSDRRCTSAAPVSTGCTISSMKSSTTVSTSTWPGSVKRSRSRSTSTAASRSWTTGAAFPPACILRRRSPPPKWLSPSCTRAASSSRAPTRSPAGYTESASPSSTRCPNGWSWKSGRTDKSSSSGMSVENPRRR